MDGRSTTFVLALALAGTGLAGCIENPEEWFSNASAEVSAFENKGLADDAARAWAADAVLVGAMAFELSESPDARIDADPDPGNGLAPAWWYVYCDEAAEDKTLRAYKVAADGTVTSEADAEAFAEGFDHGMADPIGEWRVDSHDALAAAKTDERFATVAQGYNATLVEGIASYEGLTAWWISAMSVDGFVVANVDAATGELLHVESVDMDFEMPEFEWGAANPEMMAQPIHLEGEGSAAPGDEPASFPFWVDAPMAGAIALDADASPGQYVWWEIVDAEGETVDSGSAGGYFPFGDSRGYAHELEIEEPGEYTLAIGAGGWFPMGPVASELDYAFMLDLYPEGMHPEHDAH